MCCCNNTFYRLTKLAQSSVTLPFPFKMGDVRKLSYAKSAILYCGGIILAHLLPNDLK
jgi:hypothetical protein